MRILSSKSFDFSLSQQENLKKENIEISFLPFIKISSVEGAVTWPKTDWIFFSSRNSYIYSMEKGCPIDQYKIAAVGQQTASIIDAPVNYIGANSDTKIVGQTLKNRIGSETVLFPVSNISLNTVADCFEIEQQQILTIYTTESLPLLAPPHDGLIFSSPSNVKGYQLKNDIHANMPIISFGPSTTKTCLSIGFKHIVTLNEINNENLVDTIISTFGRF